MSDPTSPPAFGAPAGAAEAIGALCGLALRITTGTDRASEVAAIADRLNGPLRIAIAGRVKAGKSTLLNALVGQRLAATDAGECTRVITVYRHATGYQVAAVGPDGTRLPLRFTQDRGELCIELDGQSLDAIDHLDVGWPSRPLERVNLIDTPGLESLNDENSRRTRDFLDPDTSSPASADAVIYLMRHLHRSDADFLGSFMDRSVMGASPVNAIAVLSRADEIGACRPTAMESSSRIAARYAADPNVRSLVSEVVPIAGLIAETGLTLRQDEYQHLATLAQMADAERHRLLLSIDDFCDIERSPVTAEIRHDLVARFGLFGLRIAIEAIASGRIDSATALSTLLVEVSGLGRLWTLIDDHFLPRARMLKARTALVSLRSLSAALTAEGHPDAGELAAAVDRADASTLEFAVLHAAHLVLTGALRLGDDEKHEVERLLSHADPVVALGIGGPDPEQTSLRALSGAGRWRQLTNDPLASPGLRTVADTMARVYERIYAGAANRV